MKQHTRTIVPFILTVCAAVSLQAAIAFASEQPAKPKSETKAASAPAEPAKSPSDVVAKVNGAPITRAELDRAVSILIAQNRNQQQTMDAATKKLVEKAALDRLIDLEVAFQAGKKLEVKDLDKLVAEKAAQGKARFPTPAEYEAALKSNHITEKEISDLIRKDVIIGNLFEKEVISKVVVSDADAKKFYDENQDKFKRPESYHASHILIGVKPEATAEEKQKAKEKAEAIRKKLLAGADFGELAKAESSCPSSKQGGDLGFFGKGEMVPSFEQALVKLKPGEISDVVETQFGYHIIKLAEKKPGGTVPFDEAKENIKKYLKQQQTQKAVSEYVAGLKKSAKIEKMEN